MSTIVALGLTDATLAECCRRHQTGCVSEQPDPHEAPATGVAAAGVRATLPWVLRLAWILTGVLGGAAIEGAVDGRSSAVRWTAGIAGWTAFAVVLVALLIPSVRSLTVLRVIGPLAAVAVVASAIGGATAVEVLLLPVPSVAALGVGFTAEIGSWMVQSSAYGDEHRLPLRPPVAAGTAAVVSWLVWAAAITIGPLCLAARNLAVGIALTIVAVALTAFVGPRWHLMSKRWLVLVPAGLVVHDPIVLADTVMVRTDQLDNLTLARADTDAADLTGPTSGYAIEITTRQSVTTVFAFTPKEPDGRAIHMTAFLVAPSRPGEALRLAVERRLPVAPS